MTQLSNRKEGRWAQGVQTPAWPHQDVSCRLVCVESSPAGWSRRWVWLAGWLMLTGPPVPPSDKQSHASQQGAASAVCRGRAGPDLLDDSLPAPQGT